MIAVDEFCLTVNILATQVSVSWIENFDGRVSSARFLLLMKRTTKRILDRVQYHDFSRVTLLSKIGKT